MKLKLKRISKLNIVVAVVMCAVLLFCFCSSSYVAQAANRVCVSEDDLIDLYLPFSSHFTKNGYHYFNSNNHIWDNKKMDSSFSNDISKIDYFSDKFAEYAKNIDSSFTFENMDDVLDMYALVVSENGNLNILYVFFAKGTKVVLLNKSSKDGIFQWSPYFYTLSDDKYIVVRNLNNIMLNDTNDIKNNMANYLSYGTVKQVANGYSFCPVYAVYAEYEFDFANIPIAHSVADCHSFLDGDESKASNKDDAYFPDKKEYPAESFYWDSMTCKPSSVGNSKYAFSFNYTYSCPLMTDPTEMFSCDVVYNSDIRYQDGKGRVHTYTDSKTDTFSLNKHKNGYVNNSLYLNSTLLDNTGSSAQHKLDELFDGIVGLFGHVDLDTRSDTEITVKSAKIYVTVFLYHVPDPDTMFSNSDIMQSAKENMIMSTDVRAFSFDLFNLREDAYGAVVKPTVTTEDVKDNDGNVVDKKVTDVAASDDSGKTVINITIDNSNKVTDGNANINTGGGSSDDDDEDKNSKSFWKYVTGIVAFFTALLNSDSGLFAVIASYFKFIPADFWSVTIGAIVVIAILSIYRLAKKGG